jgi:hypothetical protein
MEIYIPFESYEFKLVNRVPAKASSHRTTGPRPVLLFGREDVGVRRFMPIYSTQYSIRKLLIFATQACTSQVPRAPGTRDIPNFVP